jgi:hypothetical protein
MTLLNMCFHVVTRYKTTRPNRRIYKLINFFHKQNNMKSKLLVLISMLCSLFMMQEAKAQFAIRGVSYLLKYNIDSCNYEVLLVINNGFTTTETQRLAFNANISFRYKVGDTKPTIKRVYNPVNNILNTPMDWAQSTQAINPLADQGFSYVSFIPELDAATGNSVVYKGKTGGNISQGDTIKLFSLNFDVNDCSDNFRLYINGSDPASNAPGMGGGAFSNGFTIQSATNQAYQNNATQIFPPKPLISNLTTSCSNGIAIDLTASGAINSSGTPNVCQGPLSYSWTGPNLPLPTTQDINLPTATFADRGLYSVTVTDTMGCTSTASIFAEVKPNAGPDTTLCAGSTKTLFGTQPNTGVWGALSNYGGFNPSSTNAGQAIVNYATYSASTPTVYTYIYGIGSPFATCFDTMRVTVNPRPTVGFLGAPFICAFIDNNTRQLNPSGTGTPIGTWASNMPSIATVAGNVATAVAPGLATFTFTNTTTGCSNTTANLRIDPKPAVTIGSDTLCLNSTTTLTPSTNGTWSLSNSNLVVGNYVDVNNNGTFFGLRADVVGSSKAWYRVNLPATQASCISDTLNVVVLPQPTTTLITPALCVGNNGSIVPVPNVPGTWESTIVGRATINNSGVISAISPGTAQFIFTQLSTGCKSPVSSTVTITNPPVISGVPATAVCAGLNGVATLTVSSPSPGKWRSNNPTLATIDSLTGVINTLAQGIVNFTFTDGGGCTATSANMTIAPKPALFADKDSICVGASTAISTGAVTGVWSRLPASSGIIAYVGTPTTNSVVGLAPGVGQMEFTASNGCKDTIAITVSPRPNITLLGQDSLCINTTTSFSPSTGGIWSSDNNSVATINQNSGVVTAINGGAASFTFTTTEGCASNPSDPITVIPNADIRITDATLCIGDISFVSSDLDIPQGSGTWISSNTAVATIDLFGQITAISAGFSEVRYREPALGCITRANTNVVVGTRPTVRATDNNICGTETSTVSASPSAGAWSSSNSAIATVSGTGLVTPGTLPGTVTITFTAQGSGCQNTLNIIIAPKPTISNISDAEICIGDTASIVGLPAGGSWTAEPANGRATISAAGTITGVAQGTTNFRYTQAGCSSDLSAPIVINGPPTINPFPRPEICIGDTTRLTAGVPGKWISLTDSIASIDSITGVVTGLREGTLFFTFTSNATGCSAQTPTQLKVTTLGIATVSTPSICVGASAFAQPSTGGAWASSDTSVAIILNNGTIVGKKVGSARFVWQSAATGCKTAPSSLLAVTTGPVINPPADSVLCLTETTTIIAVGNPTGGTWTSENPTIASITNAGLITALLPGTSRFQYKDASGCESELSAAVFVRPKPTVTSNGPDGICIGGTTDLNANTTGTWTALNPTIATIDATSGTITGVATGVARFLFTSIDGCPADTSADIRVGVAPNVSIIGRTTICIGDTTNLFPQTGGVWTSSNNQIATVTNDGVATSLAPGFVTFTFTESEGGCVSSAATGTLTVVSCIDPDINITYVNVPVPGDVSTNDNISGTVNYGPAPTPTIKPSGSNPVITMLPDGTYTFVSDIPGVYTYNIPVCISPIVVSCPTSLLTITVLEPANPLKTPIANTDFGTTKKNTPITLNTLANDGCSFTTGCSLNPGSVLITIVPKRGNAVVGAGGNITYTPNAGLLGKDTLTYLVCVTGEPLNCATALQIITVEDSLAVNSTVAADDFNTVPENTVATGNVKTNDSDPQGHIQTVTAQTTTKPGGTLVLSTDGSYTFTPDTLFTGPISFPYVTCDNGTPSVCDTATLYILVVPDLYVKVRVYLEGALMENRNEVNGENRPLMRDDLRNSPFTGLNYIPIKDIHKDSISNNVAGYFYNVTPNGSNLNKKKFIQVGPGALSKYGQVKSPAVFAVSGENAIVDWIFIELRVPSADTFITVATRSGLLQRDGDVVEVDGVTNLKFPGLPFSNYIVVVKHRNHLAVMTQNPQTPKELTTLVDFTKATLNTYDKGIYTPAGGTESYNYKDLEQIVLESRPGYRAMWAGDFDGNGKVKYDAPDDDQDQLFSRVLGFNSNTQGFANYDFAIGYFAEDYNMNSKNKYDNPDDDKNFLYGQVILYKLNPSNLTNFDYLIQQLPEYNPE